MDRPPGPPYEDIVVEEAQPGIVVLRLSRPDRMNAMRWETYAELLDVITTIDPLALIITGAGRGFCAGDDIDAMLGGGDGQMDLGENPGLEPYARVLLAAPYPIIAAVNGPAVGWGMDLALMADFRLAGRSALFGELYVMRGVCSDVAGFGRLWQLIGRERAARMLMTGELIDAETACEWGLVGELVDDEALLPRAIEFAELLASRPPLAVRAVKESLRLGSDPDWEALGRWSGPTHQRLFKTEDHKEAVRAFRDRRNAVYHGR